MKQFFRIIYQVFKWLFLTAVFILLANIFFWSITVKVKNIKVEGKAWWYDKGTIAKVGPVAFVFGHGSWHADENFLVYHRTNINNQSITTDSLITNLRNEGAQYIWLGMCHAGERDFIIFNRITRQKKSWPANIWRGKPGINIPFWVGPWFIHLNIPDTASVDTTPVVFYDVTVSFYINPKHQSGDTIFFTAYDQSYIINSITKQFANQKPDSIVLINKFYLAPSISLSEMMKKNPSSITKSQIDQFIENNSKIVLAKGWKRGIAYNIKLKIQPLIKN